MSRICHALQDDWEKGISRNLLVQHSTGSGKSATMALLVQRLRSLRDRQGRGIALILVLSDRLQLDRQLGDVLERFLRRLGCELRRAEHSSRALREVLAAATCLTATCLTVVSTKQKLERMLDHGLLRPLLRRGRVVALCEECHRAHEAGGASDQALERLCGTKDLAPRCMISRLSRGLLAVFLALKADLGAVSAWIQRVSGAETCIGFTGTPSRSSLRRFERAVHCYHLGQAEEEGVGGVKWPADSEFLQDYHPISSKRSLNSMHFDLNIVCIYS